ncbi:MAG: TfuA domain-containing protein [Proteobacteria bacterium]|nr:TfuA domain-containing protein [Pseudomonadota bacterium]
MVDAPGHLEPDVARRAVVYLGPTLPLAQARSELDAIYLPPIVDGALIDAVERLAPAVILIIDGVFQSAPAIKHKEILWAIGQGTTVIGAASMGALRAAELYPQMHGVGMIYRWYRRFDFTADDAVAVLHAPAELQGTPLSTAHLDLRLTFRCAARRGLISDRCRRRLDAVAAATNFRDRTVENIVREVVPPGDRAAAARLALALNGSLVSQKKRDALQALAAIRASWMALRC